MILGLSYNIFVILIELSSELLSKSIILIKLLVSTALISGNKRSKSKLFNKLILGWYDWINGFRIFSWLSFANSDLLVCKLLIDLKNQNYELGRLNLIVFDFDRSDLSKFNQDLISKFVKSSIKKESEIHIIGSTDRLGDDNYNMRLSTARAENVRAFIMSKFNLANITQVKGIGSNFLKYNNELPEGRFYCRTVLIEVKTPLIQRR
mgnify:CR=1 FL=1